MSEPDAVPFLVAIPSDDGPPRLFETGLAGMLNDGAFVLPFHDEMTADEVARIVAAAIRRDGADEVPAFMEDDE